MNGFLAILAFTLLLNGTVEAQVVISSNVNSPTDGANVALTCSITGFATTAFWINNSNSAILNDCLPDGTCTTAMSGRYSYTANASAIMVRITSFSSAQDAFGWKCQHSTFVTIFTFTSTTTPTPGNTGLSTGAIVGIVIGAVVFVTGVVLVIFLIKKYYFNQSKDVKNKTVDTNNSGNRNPTTKPATKEMHAAIHKNPNNADLEDKKTFEQNERRPLPHGLLPSLPPRNVTLDDGQQNLDDSKKKKKQKKKQKDGGPTEEGKSTTVVRANERSTYAEEIQKGK